MTVTLRPLKLEKSGFSTLFLYFLLQSNHIRYIRYSLLSWISKKTPNKIALGVEIFLCEMSNYNSGRLTSAW